MFFLGVVSVRKVSWALPFKKILIRNLCALWDDFFCGCGVGG